MHASLKAVSIALLGTTMLGACATKHSVTRLRGEFERERTTRTMNDSSHALDIATLRTDVGALRAEMQTLRTEFGARITAMEDGIKFAFPVNFAYDDSNVREIDRVALDRFAAVAQKFYPNAMITIEGFADPAGSASYNVALSQRRAESVRGYLVERGIGETTLRTVGYGETRQVVRGASGDAAGAELNRRVVFVVETKGDAIAAEVTAGALSSQSE